MTSEPEPRSHDAAPRRAPRWRRTVGLLAGAAFVASLLASVLALGAARYWLADLAVHFRLQYLAVGVLALGWLAWRRRTVPALAAALLVALNAPAVLGQLAVDRPGAILRTAVAAPDAPMAPARNLRLAAANVFFASESYERVIGWVRHARPDVVVFLEASPAWQRALEPLASDYPHRAALVDGPEDGILLLSRWPLRAPRPGPDNALLALTVEADGVPLRIAGVHAAWPIAPRNQAIRAAHLDWIAREARAAARDGLPFVALGDYNITPFSPHFARLLESGGLHDAARGHGWQPTWPTFLPPLGIQIDHILVSPDLRTGRFSRGPGTGSDHRPVILDLPWPAL